MISPYEIRAKYSFATTKAERERSVWRERFMSNRRSCGAKAVKDAVTSGVLPHPKTLKCVDCGKRAFCYDHRDYSKPLMVEPVCKSCDSKRGPGKPYVDPSSKKWQKIIKDFKSEFLARRQRINQIVNGR